LAPLLEITTFLDPHLLVAYDFGANFLAPAAPLGAGEPDRAIRLVQSGISANPNEWKLYYDLGFIYYLDLHQYANAEVAFERGSQVPNAHPFMKIFAANMAQHAGDTQMARMLWRMTLENTSDKEIKKNAIAHLKALDVDDEVTALERVVEFYRQKTGHLPSKMTDLIQPGMLRGIPLDPTGRPLDLSLDGRVEIQNPDAIPFITKGLPPGYKSPYTPNVESGSIQLNNATSPQ
jgi:hypothetical protein